MSLEMVKGDTSQCDEPASHEDVDVLFGACIVSVRLRPRMPEVTP